MPKPTSYVTWYQLDPFVWETTLTGPCILTEDQFDNLHDEFDPESAESREQYRTCTRLYVAEPSWEEYQCTRCIDPTFIDPNWDYTEKLNADDLEDSFIIP